VLQEASNHGAAGRTLDQYLRVDCVVVDSTGVEENAEQIRKESVMVVQGWEQRGDFVVDASNVELKVATPNVAPYSVFPFSEQICAGLLTNRHWLRSVLNVSEVLRRFQERGWSVEEDPREEYLRALKVGKDPRESPFARIRRGALTVALAPMMCTRMLFEFLKPRSLVRGLESIFLEGPQTGKEYVLSYFPQERRNWL